MKTWTLVHAVKNRDFSIAENFVLPVEKRFLTLMNRIQNKEDCIYYIQQTDESENISRVCGVISWTSGKILTPCIPEFSQPIKELLARFLKDKDVFCLSGDDNGVEQMEAIIIQLHNTPAREKRHYNMMEYNPEKARPVTNEIIRCTKKDASRLMKLHVNYVNVEVLPSWKEAVPAVELLNLERSLKNFYVAAIEKDGQFVARALTNAQTRSYFQIGGVYTLDEYRSRGLAKDLVSHIAQKAHSLRKGCILFVKQENISAIRCYTNAGFEKFNTMKMYYF